MKLLDILLEDVKPYNYRIRDYFNQINSMSATIFVDSHRDISIDLRISIVMDDVNYAKDANELNISFEIEETPKVWDIYGELNLGIKHAFRLMETINKIMMEWIQKHNLDIDIITFMPSGQDRSSRSGSDKAFQRINLYHRTIKKIFPNTKIEHDYPFVKFILNKNSS